MDYMNPFGMVPNGSEYDSPNLLSVKQTQDKMNMAMPFVEMAKQNQGMDMQRKMMENSEFASPEAQMSRFTGLQNQTAQNQANARKAGPMADFDVADAKAKIKALPAMTDQKIAEAEQAVMSAKGKPAMDLINQMGSFYDASQTLPPQARPMLYQQFTQNWQAQHPGAQLPPQFQQYDETNLSLIKYAQLHSMEQQQKERLEVVKGEQDIAKENVKGGYTLQGHQIDASSRERVAQKNLDKISEKPVSQNVRITQLRKELAKNPENDEAKSELMEHLNDQYYKLVQKDPMLGMLAIRAAAGNEQDITTYEQAVKGFRQKFFQDNGVAPKPEASGKEDKVRVTAPDGRPGWIPRERLIDATKNGYKEVK